jgi:hypothetical protein
MNNFQLLELEMLKLLTFTVYIKNRIFSKYYKICDNTAKLIYLLIICQGEQLQHQREGITLALEGHFQH